MNKADFRKMHHINRWVEVIVFCLSFSLNVFSQDKANIALFGSNTMKFQIFMQISNHGGTLNRLVNDFSDSLANYSKKNMNFTLDSTLTLFVTETKKCIEIRYKDSTVLSVKKTKKELLIEDQYNRFENITFKLSRKRIKNVIIEGEGFKNILWFKKKEKKCITNKSQSNFPLTNDEITEYTKLFELYNLTD